jgi:NhaP-type Na+/H+ or K+/H+ antiporter
LDLFAMERPPTRIVRTRWRRRLFWGWVGVSLVVAVYVGVTAPFAEYFGEGWPVVALVVPAVRVFMLVTGLGWLALLVASRPRQDRSLR